ncbi:juvenile hormone esterase-like [Chrysoperla carnea]|uniref:juvenile hormone esterase-like n=1 Tax=Chrysoperla carnea TaxID=189513 RepID=UPI001D07F8A0|nr:juvenile hormone esterase-like [Chrysoperla carnea]
MAESLSQIWLFLLGNSVVNNCSKFGDAEYPIVHTELGKIRGTTTFQTRLGETIYSFRGIPYAEPPIGKRRFEPPSPVRPWGNNILDATKDGPVCPQPYRVSSEMGFTASEDCLQLNVYTKTISSTSKLPVLVFLHPGAYYKYSGISYFVGPEYLLDKDIVLVTINYRLGALGFISTGDEFAPGNNGLKDQVMALRWVKQNIKAFGGDPNKITLSGYSAGALSVGLHLVSPMSRGLFQRAISGSGSPLAELKFTTNQLDLAIKQARLLDCPTNSSQEIIECLRTKDAEDISTTLDSFMEVGKEPSLIWHAVIEPEHSGEKFLTDDPNKLFYKGQFSKVPFMTGVTELEYAYGAYIVVANETLRNIWNENFSYPASLAFSYEKRSDSLNISQILRDFYLKDSAISIQTVDEFGKLYADGKIGFSVNRLANVVAKHSTVFYYKFSYNGTYSYFYSPFTNKTIGAVHQNDLIYLFTNRYENFPLFSVEDPESKIIDKMITLWTNFVIYGNPTPKRESVLDGVSWKPISENTEYYLNIDTTISLNEDLFPERYALWEKQLFPLSGQFS